MLDRYLLLMKAFHVDLLSRRHQFSSITASSASVRMVSTTQIMFVLHFLRGSNFWNLSVLGSTWKTSYDEVWKTWVQEMVYNTITQWVWPSWDCMMHHKHSPIFVVLILHQGACLYIFPLLHFFGYICIFFELFLCRLFSVSCIVKFYPQSLQVMWSRFLRFFVYHFWFYLH